MKDGIIISSFTVIVSLIGFIFNHIVKAINGNKKEIQEIKKSAVDNNLMLVEIKTNQDNYIKYKEREFNKCDSCIKRGG